MNNIETTTGKKAHKLVKSYVKDFNEGLIDRREFLAYTTALGVTSASALALAGMTPEAKADGHAKRGGTLRISMAVKEIKDPAYYEWSEMGNASRDVLEYLVRWRHDGSFEPFLLESWELSDDKLVWTLNVRRGVKWNNGDDFTAKDVAFNIKRWLNLQPKSSLQARFPGLLEEYDTGDKDDEGKAVMAQRERPGAVEIVDDYTVRLNSTSVDISFIPSFADYPAAIVHHNFEKDGADFLNNPVGTGPFNLQEYKVGERIIKARRPDGDYWGDDPYLDQVVYVDLKEDPAQEFAAFSTDQIDLNYQSAADQVERLEGVDSLVKHEVATNNTGVLRFHIKTPPFDNVHLRRAILKLADNAEILKVAHNNAGAPAENHHVSPTHPEYYALPKFERNLDEARALLKKAGMEGGTIEMMAVNAPAWESQACLALADMAKEAGLTINVNILPGTAYWEKWDEWPFSLTAWNGRPLGIQVYNLAYRSGVAWNETAYNNKEFDSLLDEANGTPDAEERSKIFAKLEKMVQDDAIMVQPLWRGIFAFSQKRVQGYQMHPAYEHHLGKVWLSDA